MMFGNAAPATLLKSPREIEIMARGGAILHATLMHAKAHVRPGISTMELDTLVEGFIRSHAGAEPAFKGLYGFPGSACIFRRLCHLTARTSGEFNTGVLGSRIRIGNPGGGQEQTKRHPDHQWPDAKYS